MRYRVTLSGEALAAARDMAMAEDRSIEEVVRSAVGCGRWMRENAGRIFVATGTHLGGELTTLREVGP
jgi:hypothetical protein